MATEKDLRDVQDELEESEEVQDGDLPGYMTGQSSSDAGFELQETYDCDNCGDEMPHDITLETRLVSDSEDREEGRQPYRIGECVGCGGTNYSEQMGRR